MGPMTVLLFCPWEVVSMRDVLGKDEMLGDYRGIIYGRIAVDGDCLMAVDTQLWIRLS